MLDIKSQISKFRTENWKIENQFSQVADWERELETSPFCVDFSQFWLIDSSFGMNDGDSWSWIDGLDADSSGRRFNANNSQEYLTINFQ